ncbi:MAG: MFS transporter [Planctomycetia bacterium]|nr:MFS transporter [Planctomycetia bacterium]
MLKTRSFSALTCTQFLGAFNDNVFKQFVLLIAMSLSLDWLPIDSQSMAMGLFALPFVIFAVIGGSIGDRFPKRTVIIMAKLGEVLIMALGMLAFALASVDQDLGVMAMMGVLFLMGTQSAFFGPSKYGIIPEMVKEADLTRANAIISMTTNLAIILGTAFAGLMFLYLNPGGDLSKGSPNWWSGILFISIGLIGWISARFIESGKKPSAPMRRLEWNPITELKALAKDKPLLGAVLSTGWFYLIGGLTMVSLNECGIKILNMDDGGSRLFFFVAGGIAIGSLLASKLSGEKVEIGIVPIGGLLMSSGFALTTIVDETLLGYGTTLTLAGIGGGLFLVPLVSYIQERSKGEETGRVQGAQVLVTFIFIFMSAIVWNLLVHSNALALSPEGTLLAIAALTLVGTLGVFFTVPHIAVRFPVWILVNTLYKIRIMGMENIPRRGGALLVVNHLSYADPFLVGASVPRFVHFLMHRQFKDMGMIGWASHLMRAIPVSSEDGPRAIIKSLEEAAERARKGNIVCIFAEGGISRTGNLLPFSKGLEKIARKADVPIIPMYLDRVWGSIFSFRGKKFFFKRPLRLPYPVTVTIGEPLPSTATSREVRDKVEELSAQALDSRKQPGITLATRFLTVARKSSRRTAVIEQGKSLNFRKLLILVLVLRRKLRHRLKGQQNIGVILPAGIGGAATNLALAVLGKTTSNLNFTAGTGPLKSACEQLELKTIISADLFTKKINLDISEFAPDVEVIDLPALLAREVTTKDKVIALLTALLPSTFLRSLPAVPHDPDSDVSVMFSSGSTGTPKGVRLSHHNILSNVRSVSQIFDVDHNDRVVGSLPFFHVFGYTITLWFPLGNAIGAIYHPNPMDTDAIAELTREQKGTIFLSTPTFYRTYLRKFNPEDFKSVRIAGAGAEKLKASLAEAWEEKFGSPLLEGYGCTELSPVVSVNLPDLDVPGFRQKTRKLGTIGLPVPGVVTRIVDPENGEDLPHGEPGLLLIKGPSVLTGYLGRDDLTKEAFEGEWYKTGDIAKVDNDGFLIITDRLSRFSKLGGEMVPHVLIEEAIQEYIDQQIPDEEESGGEAMVAVTSVPDDAKGEKLVVIHGKLPVEAPEIIENLRSRGDLPNLWIPRPEAFVPVDEVPRLGSGKLDLKAVKNRALEHFGFSD